MSGVSCIHGVRARLMRDIPRRNKLVAINVEYFKVVLPLFSVSNIAERVFMFIPFIMTLSIVSGYAENNILIIMY